MAVSSALLAQFLGLYIFAVSWAFIFKHEEFSEYAREFIENRSMRYNLAFFELGLGLALVLTHNIWEFSYRGVITVIGWMVLLEAIFHLLASDEHERKLIEPLLQKRRCLAMGILAVYLGIYLMGKGFGMF